MIFEPAVGVVEGRAAALGLKTIAVVVVDIVADVPEILAGDLQEIFHLHQVLVGTITPCDTNPGTGKVYWDGTRLACGTDDGDAGGT